MLTDSTMGPTIGGPPNQESEVEPSEKLVGLVLVCPLSYYCNRSVADVLQPSISRLREDDELSKYAHK